MFGKNCKFKKGDKVMLLSDMSESREVLNVFYEVGHRYTEYGSIVDYIPKIVLSNNRVYKEADLASASLPINILSSEVAILTAKLKELEDKMFSFISGEALSKFEKIMTSMLERQDDEEQEGGKQNEGRTKRYNKKTRK